MVVHADRVVVARVADAVEIDRFKKLVQHNFFAGHLRQALVFLINNSSNSAILFSLTISASGNFAFLFRPYLIFRSVTTGDAGNQQKED